MSDLLSIQEVAEITGLHEITIRRYVRSGELEAVRIGRRIRVRRAALDKLLKPLQPDATPEAVGEGEQRLQESATVYQVAKPGRLSAPIPALIGQVATGLVQLPDEDIAMVARLVERLQPRQPAAPPAAAAIVAAARQQAAQLGDVPRSDIAARFELLVEEIRQQAIARGTAIEGDWRND